MQYRGNSETSPKIGIVLHVEDADISLGLHLARVRVTTGNMMKCLDPTEVAQVVQPCCVKSMDLIESWVWWVWP